MYNFDKIKTKPACGEKYREEYLNCIEKLLDKKIEESKAIRENFISPEKVAIKREEYREQYCDMLGWPLNEFTHNYKPNFEKELVEELDFVKIYRLRIETFEGFWCNGLIYEPAYLKEKAPLIVLNPGGGYCVEELMAHEGYDASQIKSIGEEFLKAGAVVYAPQHLLWDNLVKPPIAQPERRQFIDIKLKAMGGSIAAVEIFNVRRALDYFIANESIDENRIGMAGLSYGGFYTLYISAADTRIKSSFSSCFYCDRFGNEKEMGTCRSDWMWHNSAYKFFDAEVASLIAPRALYLEATKNDIFPLEIVQKEHARLIPFFKAADAEDKLKILVGEGKHEIIDGTEGIKFFLDNLL